MASIRTSPAQAAFLLAAVAAEAAALVVSQRPPLTAALVLLVAFLLIGAFARPGVVLAAAAFVVACEQFGINVPPVFVAGFAVDVTDMMIGLLLLAWAGWELNRRDAGARVSLLGREPAALPFAVFMLLGFVDLARGGYGTFSSGRIFGYAVVLPLLLRVLDSRRVLRAAAAIFVAGGVVQSAVACVMLVTGRSAANGLSTGGARALSIGASILVAGALLAVLAVVATRDRPRAHLREALVVLALIAGIAASGARETFLGVVAALAVFGLATGARGIVRVGAAIALAGAIAGGALTLVPQPAQLSDHLVALERRVATITPAAAQEDPSVVVRYEKWSVVWAQMKAHPVLGTGFGYPATYTSNIGGQNFQRAYVDDPENTHLWLWARMGTVGFAAWVAFNLVLVGSALAFVRRARAPAARAAALWSAGTLPLIWSGMAFSPVSAFSPALLLYWAAVGALPVARRIERGAAAAAASGDRR